MVSAFVDDMQQKHFEEDVNMMKLLPRPQSYW